ncbi:MAG: 2-oxoacid:acceptor oxidoreductase family protein [Angelakisella sp.]
MSSKNWNFVFAGFGGQGILFAGKVTAYTGMVDNREVSWLPSYGPEMRGGTANCSVCLSATPIGSPLVLSPNALVVMNGPSYDKFIDTVEPGGVVIIDSTLIEQTTLRTDITALYLPATKLAKDAGIPKLANLIMLGALVKATGFTTQASLEQAIQKCVPAKKPELLELNLKAIELGKQAVK